MNKTNSLLINYQPKFTRMLKSLTRCQFALTISASDDDALYEGVQLCLSDAIDAINELLDYADLAPCESEV